MDSRSRRRQTLLATWLWWVVAFEVVFAAMVAGSFVAEAYEDSALRFLTTAERYAAHQAEWTAEGLELAAASFGFLIVPGVLLAAFLLAQRRLRRAERA